MENCKSFFLRAAFCAAFSAGIVPVLDAQSVSTQVQKKAVLLEEYTGVGCGNCPDGAAVASTIKEAAGNRFYVVAIHEGPYAEPWGDLPDYRTDWGQPCWRRRAISATLKVR